MCVSETAKSHGFQKRKRRLYDPSYNHQEFASKDLTLDLVFPDMFCNACGEPLPEGSAFRYGCRAPAPKPVSRDPGTPDYRLPKPSKSSKRGGWRLSQPRIHEKWLTTARRASYLISVAFRYLREACLRSPQGRLAVIFLILIPASLSWTPLHAGTLVPTYGTYFGGSGDTNVAVAVALDPSGNVIVAGYTTSQTLPGTANAFQPTKARGFPDNRDVFIAKFDLTGRTLIWATFLGGDADDTPVALAVDSSGGIYVTGITTSTNFPAQSSIACTPVAGYINFNSSAPFQQNCSLAAELGQPPNNSFISKISSDGTALSYSVTLQNMQATALTVDKQAEAYLATVGVSGAVFLFRLNTTGSSLIYGTFLGGTNIADASRATSLAVDSSGNCFLGGVATGSLPTTSDALESSDPNSGLENVLNQPTSGFILEVNASGSQLLYGTYFGPRYFTTAVSSLALNSDGSLYLAGSTNATAFQATAGAYFSMPAGGFIAKFSPGSTQLSAFSYLPSPPITTCGGLGSQTCESGAMMIASQTQTAYVLLASQPYIAYEFLELGVPAFGVVSPDPSFVVPPQTDFAPGNIALAAPSSIWVVGACTSCSLGSLISDDAFQPTPGSSTESAVLIQLTDISPAVSFLGGSATGTSPFAAGQLVSIYGSQIGPGTGTGLELGPGEVVTTSNSGTQVLFDGTPAPIIYTSAGQVNTVIPCAVAGHTSTQMVVAYMGAQSAPLTVPLGPAAPGIFTADGSGQGQAAALNQDNSFNSPSNPAPRGSIVTFYATGVGPTSPCADGQVYERNFPTLTLPVIVGVGSSGAQVLYSGQAPDLVSGVAQFNIVIPSDATTGVVPLTVVVGAVFSKPGVTIAVK